MAARVVSPGLTHMAGIDRKHLARALALALLAAAASLPGVAQDRAIARLKSVTGNVLVSHESGLAAGSAEQRLAPGTRVITTANSEAVVLFDNGCEIRLKENERFEVESDKACALMVAQPMGAPPVAAVGAPILALLLPGGAGGLILSDILDTTPVSPN